MDVMVVQACNPNNRGGWEPNLHLVYSLSHHNLL